MGVKDMPHLAVPSRSTEPGRRPGRPNHESMAEAAKEHRKFQLEQMSKAARYREVARRRFDDTEVIDLEVATESTIMCNGVVMKTWRRPPKSRGSSSSTHMAAMWTAS